MMLLFVMCAVLLIRAVACMDRRVRGRALFGEHGNKAELCCEIYPAKQKIERIQWFDKDGKAIYSATYSEHDVNGLDIVKHDRRISGKFGEKGKFHTITIDKPKLNHEGWYSCVAYNNGTSYTDAVQLELVVLPSINPMITFEDGSWMNETNCCGRWSTHYITYNDEVKLTCSVGYSKPAPKLTWRTDDIFRSDIKEEQGDATLGGVHVSNYTFQIILKLNKKVSSVTCLADVPSARTGGLDTTELCLHIENRSSQKNTVQIMIAVQILLGVIWVVIFGFTIFYQGGREDVYFKWMELCVMCNATCSALGLLWVVAPAVMWTIVSPNAVHEDIIGNGLIILHPSNPHMAIILLVYRLIIDLLASGIHRGYLYERPMTHFLPFRIHRCRPKLLTQREDWNRRPIRPLWLRNTWQRIICHVVGVLFGPGVLFVLMMLITIQHVETDSPDESDSNPDQDARIHNVDGIIPMILMLGDALGSLTGIVILTVFCLTTRKLYDPATGVLWQSTNKIGIILLTFLALCFIINIIAYIWIFYKKKKNTSGQETIQMLPNDENNRPHSGENNQDSSPQQDDASGST